MPARKRSAPEPPIVPRIGDKVMIPRGRSPLEITHVYHGGEEVNLQLPRTNLEWFRVKADTLTYVERKPPTRTPTLSRTPSP